jgi:hypothetical protein
LSHDAREGKHVASADHLPRDLPVQTLKCPLCGKVHEWAKSDAYLRADGGG